MCNVTRCNLFEFGGDCSSLCNLLTAPKYRVVRVTVNRISKFLWRSSASLSVILPSHCLGYCLWAPARVDAPIPSHNASGAGDCGGGGGGGGCGGVAVEHSGVSPQVYASLSAAPGVAVPPLGATWPGRCRFRRRLRRAKLLSLS